MESYSGRVQHIVAVLASLLVCLVLGCSNMREDIVDSLLKNPRKLRSMCATDMMMRPFCNRYIRSDEDLASYVQNLDRCRLAGYRMVRTRRPPVRGEKHIEYYTAHTDIDSNSVRFSFLAEGRQWFLINIERLDQ